MATKSADPYVDIFPDPSAVGSALATILTLCRIKRVIEPDGKEIIPAIGVESGFARSVALACVS